MPTVFPRRAPLGALAPSGRAVGAGFSALGSPLTRLRGRQIASVSPARRKHHFRAVAAFSSFPKCHHQVRPRPQAPLHRINHGEATICRILLLSPFAVV